MLEQLLAREEGKTLEFKENSLPIQRIVQTAIAFANTAGGIILLGIKNNTKEVVGLENILQDELRVANAIAASVFPLLIPNLQFCSWRHREILIITIPHSLGPYYLQSKGCHFVVACFWSIFRTFSSMISLKCSLQSLKHYHHFSGHKTT